MALSAILLWMKELPCSSYPTWKTCHQGQGMLVGLSRELNMFMSLYKEKRRDTRELRVGVKLRGEREGWEVLWVPTGKLDAK